MADSSRSVGVVGLGRIGALLVPHLIRAGFEVFGFDVRAEALDEMEAAGGVRVASPAALTGEVEVVITSLPSLAALDVVVRGPDGLINGLRSGIDVVETSTLGPADKETLRGVLAASGMTMLDCPISGTSGQMVERDVVIYASGDEMALVRQRDVLAAISRTQYNVGEFGNGSKLKLIANHLVAIHTAAAAEALLLAERSGIDPDLALQALSDGAGSSAMLRLRGPMMVAKDFAAANMRLELFIKDLELIRWLSRESECPVPLLDLCVPFYTAAARQGGNSQDPAAVAAFLATIPPPAKT